MGHKTESHKKKYKICFENTIEGKRSENKKIENSK